MDDEVFDVPVDAPSAGVLDSAPWWLLAVAVALLVVAAIAVTVAVMRTRRDDGEGGVPPVALPGPRLEVDDSFLGPITAGQVVDHYEQGKRRKVTKMIGVTVGQQWLSALDTYGPLIAAWVRRGNRDAILASMFDVADAPPSRLRGVELTESGHLAVLLAEHEGGPAAALFCDNARHLRLHLGHEVQVTRPISGVVRIEIDPDPDALAKMMEQHDA